MISVVRFSFVVILIGTENPARQLQIVQFLKGCKLLSLYLSIDGTSQPGTEHYVNIQLVMTRVVKSYMERIDFKGICVVPKWCLRGL